MKLGRVRSSLRLVRSASATLPAEVLNKLEALFGVPVIETYGMTEGSSQIASNPLDWRKLGSVGRATGPEIVILDDDDRLLAPGQQGEIALRGPTITRGYENDAAATAAAFRNGWFRTGDLGYIDADGFVFIVGRSKEVIKRGGLQVAPAEVEDVLLRHPDVIDAVAFSVPHERLGEDVAVAIVARPDAQVSPQQIRSFAARTPRELQGARPRSCRAGHPEELHRQGQSQRNGACARRCVTGAACGSRLHAAAFGRRGGVGRDVGGNPRGRANRGRSGRICARRRFACRHANAFAAARTLRRRPLVRGHLQFAERRYARRAPPVIGSGRRCAALESRPRVRRSRERPALVSSSNVFMC